MRGERLLLRLGEYLVSRACQQLPGDIREERYREWTAELPAILHDPQVRLAPRRAARMLVYAADTFRGTALAPVQARRLPSGVTAVLYLWLLACLANVAWNMWVTVRAPGQGLNYLQLAWSLVLVAFPLSLLARVTYRVLVLNVIASNLAGAAAFLWNVAQAPGDWVNYFATAFVLLPLLALWLRSRWARSGRHAARRVAG
jgi:hypothetical protein